MIHFLGANQFMPKAPPSFNPNDAHGFQRFNSTHKMFLRVCFQVSLSLPTDSEIVHN